MSTKNVYKTVYQVTVLSEGELEIEIRDDDPFGLLALNYEIVDGHRIGMVECVTSEKVPEDEVKDKLVEMGNDGTFFDDGPDEEDLRGEE